MSAQVEAAAQQVKAAEALIQRLEHKRERARRAVKSSKDPYMQIVDVYVAIEDKHNYVIRRRDGTTAAERFAGVPHADLFEHLVA